MRAFTEEELEGQQVAHFSPDGTPIWDVDPEQVPPKVREFVEKFFAPQTGKK